MVSVCNSNWLDLIEPYIGDFMKRTQIKAAASLDLFEKVAAKHGYEVTDKMVTIPIESRTDFDAVVVFNGGKLAVHLNEGDSTADETEAHNNMGSFMQEWSDIRVENKVSTKAAQPLIDFVKDFFDAASGEKVDQVTAGTYDPKVANAFSSAAKLQRLKVVGPKEMPYVEFEPKSGSEGDYMAVVYCVPEDKSLDVQMRDAEGDETNGAFGDNLADFLKSWKKCAAKYEQDYEPVAKLASEFFKDVEFKAVKSSSGTPAIEVPYTVPQTMLELLLKQVLKLPNQFVGTDTAPGIRETTVQSSDIFETGSKYAQALENLGFTQEQVKDRIEPGNAQAVSLSYRNANNDVVWLTAQTPTVVAIGVWENKSVEAKIETAGKDPYSVFDAVAKKYKAKVTFHPAGRFHTADVPELVSTEDGDMSMTLVQNGNGFGVTLYDETGEDAAYTTAQHSLKAFMSKWRSIVRKLGIQTSHDKTVSDMAKEFFQGIEQAKLLAKVEARLSVTAKSAFDPLKPLLFGILKPIEIRALCDMPNVDDVFVTEAVSKKLQKVLKDAGWTIKHDNSDDLYGGIQYIAVKRNEPSLIMSEDMRVLDSGARDYIRLEALPAGKMYPKEFAKKVTASTPKVFTTYDQWEAACGQRDLYITFDNKDKTASAHLPPKNKKSSYGDQVGMYDDKLDKGWLFEKATDFDRFDFSQE